jgi:hypothetical protein
VTWTQNVHAFNWVLFTYLSSARANTSRIFAFWNDFSNLYMLIFHFRKDSRIRGRKCSPPGAFGLNSRQRRGTGGQGTSRTGTVYPLTLQRINIENLKQIFPQKELRGHSPYFNIHVCLWAIYIFTGLICLFCCGKYVDRSWKYINRSQTHECVNWDWGRAIPRKGIHKWDFRCSDNNKDGSLRSSAFKKFGW